MQSISCYRNISSITLTQRSDTLFLYHSTCKPTLICRIGGVGIKSNGSHSREPPQHPQSDAEQLCRKTLASIIDWGIYLKSSKAIASTGKLEKAPGKAQMILTAPSCRVKSNDLAGVKFRWRWKHSTWTDDVFIQTFAPVEALKGALSPRGCSQLTGGETLLGWMWFVYLYVSECNTEKTRWEKLQF